MIECQNALLHAAQQLDVMGSDQYRHAHLIERHEHVHDISCVIGVKVAGWLIRNKDGGPVDYGAGNAQALLLTP